MAAFRMRIDPFRSNGTGQMDGQPPRIAPFHVRR